jgi:hypothetical protein
MMFSMVFAAAFRDYRLNVGTSTYSSRLNLPPKIPRNHWAPWADTAGMSAHELGRHRFTFGPFALEWYDGGGFCESHLVWRLCGVPFAIALAGAA